MKRRVLLSALPFALSGCLSALPGPTGPRNPPTEPEGDTRDDPQKALVTGNFRFKQTDDGKLRAVVTVTNRLEAEQTGTVTGVLTLNGKTYERTARVTVGSEATVDVDIVFETIEFNTFRNSNSFGFEATVVSDSQ